jgi:hypothetical protein
MFTICNRLCSIAKANPRKRNWFDSRWYCDVFLSCISCLHRNGCKALRSWRPSIQWMKVYQPNGKAATCLPVLQCSHLRVGKAAGGVSLKQSTSFHWGLPFSIRRAYVILGSWQLPATSLRRLISARVKQAVAPHFRGFLSFLMIFPSTFTSVFTSDKFCVSGSALYYLLC